MRKQETRYSIISKYYAEHVEDVRTFVRSRIGNSAEAADIVQNAFLRLLTLDAVLTSSTLASLVYTVVRNMITDYYRHRRAVDEYMNFAGNRAERCIPGSLVYSVAEIYGILESGMARLTENQRRIYRMSLYDGMGVSDISETLNMKYKTVESRLGMARKEIRQYVTLMFA